MIYTLKRHSVFFLILLAGTLLSCNHNTFYHKSIALTNEVWNKDSAFVFELSIHDSLQFYRFYIDVRNTTNYGFQNLPLFFTTQFPDNTLFTDTLNCILSDAHGRWNGKGSGRIKDNRFVFKQKVRFPQTGIYTFSVQQASREVDLKGVTDFGITLQYE